MCAPARLFLIAAVATLVALSAYPASGAEAPFRPRQAPATAAPPATTPPPAQSPAATREALADLLLQLESLQNEVRRLRGTLEVQAHELEQLKQRSREALADMDQRLRELERRGIISPSAAAPPSPGPVVPAKEGGSPLSAPPVTAASPVAEQEQYDAAFQLLKQGLYERAAQAFRAFIAKYPQSPLADNAQYWIGEAYYVTRDFRTAREEFAKVVKQYPASPKVPDALLKIGYSHYELAEWDKAREALNEVLKRFPGTTVAKSAELRLAKMKKEGH